jgi:YD repeat-containing protein
MLHRGQRISAAMKAAYLIGYFDGDGRLTHVVKMYRDEFFFEYLYAYHPNGRLQSARVTRGGRVTVLEYDARGRRVSDASIAF